MSHATRQRRATPTNTLTQSYERELLALQAITDTALAHLDLPALMQELLKRVLEIMAVDNVALLLMEPDGQTLVLRAIHGMEERVPQVRVPVGQGFAGQIAASCQPLLVEDLNTFPVAHIVLRELLHSVLGVPLIINDRLLGVLHIGTMEAHHFTCADVQLLRRVADRMALAIDHARLYTEAQQARAEAEERARQMEAIFNAVVDGVVVYNADGTIAASNPAMREMFALYRTPDYEALSVEERARLSQPHDVNGVPLSREQWPQTRMLRGEHLAGSPNGDILVRGMNGHEIYVSVAGRPVHDAAGNIVSAIAVMRDVTERHQIEEERQQLDRLKDTFIHIASHELRAPLTPLILSAQLLQQHVAKGAAPELLQQRASEIVVHAKRMSRMVGEMLNMTRISEGRLTIALEPADLAQMAREVVAEYRMVSGRTIQLTGAEAPVPAICDAERIRQVLTNLLTNALKYAPAPAEITVSVSADEGGGTCIAVRDTGPGIAPEVQAHLFERFYRGTQQQDGLGLGLYIAQAIMQEHGGRLRVESAIGQGSTFVMELPTACSLDGKIKRKITNITEAMPTD